MIDIIKIREEYEELINEDLEGNRKGALLLKDNLERTPLYFKNRFASYTVQIPRVYSEKEINLFENVVAVTYNIFNKVIEEYLNNEDYRKLFPFSKELEELILTPCGYDFKLPIARFDIFYHEKTGEFYFCEINTDGTSGMNEDRIQDELNIDNPAHQKMIRRYNFSTFEMFDSWVKTFMEIYSTYDKKVSNPNIAIVDFLDGATLREFQEFARHFQKAGYNCEICDIRKMRYKNGKLYSENGNVIDAIYRRAVTVDIINNLDEVSDFYNAIKDNACFMAGSFKTQILHHKYLFYILHLERTMQFLTKEEIEFVKEHVPYTVPFNEEFISLDEVINNKAEYIIKPDDDYGSSGVFAGVELSQEEWEQKVSDI
ncbi:MAG: hypothetical protein K5644_00925, partial [Lachnospiraceae bacterium]|nr:hypothetical protein [Lachnospiraceae bacterium]